MSENSLRNLEIVERLFRDNSTFQDIANDYGLTRERVRYIFISVFRSLQSPSLLDAGVVLPDYDCFDLNVLRKERDLWLHQLEKLRKVVRIENDDPLIAHLNIPVRLTKDLFFVNTYEALRRAFVAYNNHRPPNDISNYKIPEHFPCFVKISYKDETDEVLEFNTLSLPVVEDLMSNYRLH